MPKMGCKPFVFDKLVTTNFALVVCHYFALICRKQAIAKLKASGNVFIQKV